jgi:hypothetical protein
MERQKYIDSILERLMFLKSKVETSTKLNLTDTNIHSENFYRDFLNLLYGYNLENLNTIQLNTAGIDLGDVQSKIAIQVTSTSSLSKTNSTVETFIKNELYKTYDRLCE